ncbi:DUF2059 domain-containing protein [Brevundimonas lenta]|uniref:DUF2059 domain-containing protein n=1 Tax=Brevundimonas lenta TaxID=424796 RepID=A0A7W6NQG4_9CAUL|nr:DUF2059 domain-containing protein [Brevundimonas lenta]MBB4083554.1 hypothetical protein [Brevundimonas lenta]
MRLMIVCAAALLATAAIPATASAAVEPPQAATAPSTRQLDLSRRYISLMMSDQFESVIHEMLGDEFDNDSSARNLPEEDRRMIIDLTAELTTDMVPQMIEAMVPAYAAAFTEEELVALIAFYETPLGRSIAEKTITVMPEANRAIMSVIPQMLDKLATRMCQRYRCTPAQLEQLRQGMREGAGLAPASNPK